MARFSLSSGVQHCIPDSGHKTSTKTRLMSPVAANFLFCQRLSCLTGRLRELLISARHQKKATILTTNLPFADWGKVFDSTTVATAIADRLVHRSEVLILEGTSYRRKQH